MIGFALSGTDRIGYLSRPERRRLDPHHWQPFRATVYGPLLLTTPTRCLVPGARAVGMGRYRLRSVELECNSRRRQSV